jgi:Rieske Fe-S protein
MDANRGAARPIDRRTALTGAVVLAGAAGLAACSSSSSHRTPATSGNPAGSGNPGGSSNPGGASSSGGAATTPAGGPVSLAKLASIPVGKCVAATLHDQPIIVSRPTATTAACFSAICTHMGCTVAPAGTQLHCPCHGSVYSATTGKVLGGPAPRPLPPIAVEVQNGEVVARA